MISPAGRVGPALAEYAVAGSTVLKVKLLAYFDCRAFRRLNSISCQGFDLLIGEDLTHTGIVSWAPPVVMIAKAAS